MSNFIMQNGLIITIGHEYGSVGYARMANGQAMPVAIQIAPRAC